jgi:hypothetical protein
VTITFRRKLHPALVVAGRSNLGYRWRIVSPLTFTSFQHGGFTEAADADLSDAEIRAQGRHKSAKVLPKYAKRTIKQMIARTRKRRATRTKSDDLS